MLLACVCCRQELSDIRGVVDGRMPALLPGPGDVMVGDRALVQIRVHVWNVGDYIEVGPSLLFGFARIVDECT